MSERSAEKEVSLRVFARDFAAFAGGRLVPAGLLLLLGAVVESAGLLLLLPLLSVMLDVPTGLAWMDRATAGFLALVPGAGRAWHILLLLGLFALLMTVRAVVILLRDVLLTRLQVGFVEEHRRAIIRALAATRWDVVARLRHGRITHVLGQDVQACGNAAHLLLQNAVAATLLLGQLVLVFLLSPLLALFVVVIAAGSVPLLQPVLRTARRTGTQMTETQLNLMNVVTQFLGGLKLAVSQDLQKSFVAEFEGEIDAAARNRVAFARQRALTQIAITSWAAAGAGLAILLGATVTDTAPATLLAFLFIVARMSGPAATIQTSFQHIFYSLPAYGKIRALQEELGGAARWAPDEAGGPLPPAPEGPVRFEAVSFSHRVGGEGPSGVADLSLMLEPGELVGVTGPSGAGKTTFLDLLVGLYSPQSGRILVGETELSGPALAAWRRRIAYVSQDSFLFHESIRANLRWVAPQATEQELWESLSAVGADALVRALPEGLDTVVGERGSLLSGGERQRIALARALLRRPQLLLLDEATNALDPASERRIVAAIASLRPRPTVILVAHRQESLGLCDRIVTFEVGGLPHPPQEPD